MSRCRHYQGKWDAGSTTASSNHYFMVASFREQLGSKLTAYRHHGQVPAASWFQANASKRPFVDSASTAEMFRGSFGGLNVLKLILFSQKAAAMHNDTSLKRGDKEKPSQKKVHIITCVINVRISLVAFTRCFGHNLPV